MYGNLCICIQIRNLKQLHVHCGIPDVFITHNYGEFLVHQAKGGISNTTTPSKPSLVFSGDDISDANTVYFFLPKYVKCMIIKQVRCSENWAEQLWFSHRRKSEVMEPEEPVYTDCWAELWANQPHPLCNRPVLVSYKAIPLRDHDQKGQNSNYM